jgi:RNA polymerase sigma-70 factor (ECF subfamily)
MSLAVTPKRPHEAPRAMLRVLPVVRDDAAVLAGLRAGEAWAKGLFFERYAPHVERILRRVLGNDAHGDLADLVHDAFIQALRSLDAMRDPQALLAWMQTIATRTAYRAIRARRARRWLRFWAPEELPDPPSEADPASLEAYRRTYAVLNRMPADERVAFALRYIDGMDLAEVARACEVSLATIKRRLVKAEERFVAAAQKDDLLAQRLLSGGRWTI